MPKPVKPELQVELEHAVASPNKRKKGRASHNIDHLLGFSLPPRVHVPARRAVARTHRDPSYTRDRFIHARYRFVLNPLGDYTAHFCDADIHLHWPNILQVLVETTAHPIETLAEAEDQENFCPICLTAQPAAPRMTRCGHVFCYPCLLHLFELSDVGKWSKCPVCSNPIHTKDLKSVSFVQPPLADGDSALPEVGEYMTLRLMERPQITTLALPRSATWPSDAVPHLSTPWHFSPDAFTYARLMLSTPEYMVAALTRDLNQLNALCSHDEAVDLDQSFVVAAKKKVAEQMTKAEALRTPAILSARKRSMREIQEVLETHKRLQGTLAFDSQASTSASGASSADESPALPEVHPNPMPVANRKRNLNPDPPESTTYHFYQAATGANVFLHPLDIKILKAHFHTYAAFPDRIRVKVEGKDEGVVTDDLRRRCKYLGHLPAQSDATFLEVDLEPIVGTKALEPYLNTLKTRRTKRRDKLRREDRAKQKHEEKERATLFESLSGSAGPAARAVATSRPVAIEEGERQALRAVDDDQALGSPPSPSAWPPAQRTVWGTRLVAATAERRGASPTDEESDTDRKKRNWEAAWADFETRAIEERFAEQQLQSPASLGRRKHKKITLTLGGSGRGR